MLGNLLLLGHRLQFRQGKHFRILNQAADSQRITGEVVSCECAVFLRIWHCAVGPEMRRDILLGVLTVGIKPFDKTFEPADDEAAGFLNHSRMPDRERRGESPSDDDDGHRRDEYSEAD